MKQGLSQCCHNLSLYDRASSKFQFLSRFLGDFFAYDQKNNSDKKPVLVCAANLSLNGVNCLKLLLQVGGMPVGVGNMKCYCPCQLVDVVSITRHPTSTESRAAKNLDKDWNAFETFLLQFRS